MQVIYNNIPEKICFYVMYCRRYYVIIIIIIIIIIITRYHFYAGYLQ